MLWPPERHPRDKKWMERLGWWSSALFLVLAVVLSLAAWWLRHDGDGRVFPAEQAQISTKGP